MTAIVFRIGEVADRATADAAPATGHILPPTR